MAIHVWYTQRVLDTPAEYVSRPTYMLHTAAEDIQHVQYTLRTLSENVIYPRNVLYMLSTRVEHLPHTVYHHAVGKIDYIRSDPRTRPQNLT